MYFASCCKRNELPIRTGTFFFFKRKVLPILAGKLFSFKQEFQIIYFTVIIGLDVFERNSVDSIWDCRVKHGNDT